MQNYQKVFNVVGVVDNTVIKRLSDNAFIPFDPANTDYAQFKKAISEETAQLQDSDGVIMSSEDAKQFVSTLP